MTADLLTTYLESYASRLPVRTVAVVGNAPLAPSTERRDRIDAADVVIRCNSVMLDEPDAEPCLGTKTDIVLLAKVTRVTPYVFRDYARRAYLVPEAGQMRALGGKPPPVITPSWPADLGCVPVPNAGFAAALVAQLDPGDGRYAVPTTGTLSAFVGYTVFPGAELMLTGFSFLHAPEQTEWLHHYGDASPVHEAHLLDRERALMQSWIDAGRAVYVP